MRKGIISTLAVAAAAMSLLSAPAAFAQGGSGGGGPAPKPTPVPQPGPTPAPSPAPPTGGGGGAVACVSIDAFVLSSDQSLVSSGASGAASIGLSRCGTSSGHDYTITMTATDPAGTVAWTTTDTWTPIRNFPFGTSHATDALAFNTTYQVTLAVTDAGAAVSSKTLPLSTPIARIPACASITSMNASGGYNPGSKTMGAIWAGYRVWNCGGTDQLDMELVETNVATGIVAWRAPHPTVMANGATGGVGLIDNDYAPLYTTYEVRVNVHEHSTGEYLATQSMIVSTPAS